MTDIVIASAARTAVGSFGGSFAKTPAHDLGSTVLSALVERAGIKKEEVSETILGQVLSSGQGQNPARQSSMLAELPIEKSALTINQVCGSGLRAVSLGAQSIMTNQSEIVIAGGQESMTNAHHTINVRNGLKMGDGKLKDSMIIDGLWCAMNDYHMGTTAENISEKYNISKQDQDEFATLSQNKAEDAQKKINKENQSLNLFKSLNVFYKSRKELDNLCGRDEITHQGLVAEVEQLDEITLKEFVLKNKNKNT